MQFTNKKILIYGSGISGRGAAEALSGNKNRITIYDDNMQASLPNIKKFSLIITSPSIHKSHKIWQQAKDNNIQIINEIDLAFLLSRAPIIGVTGTNGKTTTVKLLGQIGLNAGFKTCVAGNVGVSASRLAVLNGDFNLQIYELSSFMLDTIKHLKPHIAVITNITPDHLDIHGTMEQYASAKCNITLNQTAGDFLVLSADDIALQYINGYRHNSETYYFSAKDKVRGAYVYNNEIFFCGQKICNVNQIKMQGYANLLNALAAVTAAKLFEIKTEPIVDALTTFMPDHHRLQTVATIGQTTYINDSKATNIDSTLKACNSLQLNTFLILGGSDKGYQFDELFEYLPKHITQVCAIGQTAPKILDAAERQGYKNISAAADLAAAVKLASAAQDISYVLLSPAAASFDQFINYEHRGNEFMRLVNLLQVK